MEVETSKDVQKTFLESIVTLRNRNKLTITGVEKVFEATSKNFCARVFSSNMSVEGEDLNIAKLDVETGLVELEGKIVTIKYNAEKQGFLKKIFK